MSLTSMVLLAQAAPPEASWMTRTELIGINLWQWLGLLALAAAAVGVGALLQWLILKVGEMLAKRTAVNWDERFLAILPGPLRIILGLLLFYLVLPLLDLTPEATESVELVVRVLVIISITWFASRFVGLAAVLLEAFLSRQVDDPIRLRSLHTQIAIPRVIVRFVVILLGTALVLLQFEVVRSVGVSLLASAGLAGIIVGLAAQRTISNLLAGIQMAFFQPVRIGDVVIVENEWGWIEEIGLTFVVVKIWDLRRLILPVSYFLERPFQNWTKSSSDLLGTVYLYADYTVPIEDIRKELTRILGETDLWDGKAQGITVTNLTGSSVEVRALVSARDGGAIWDLRCLVREKLLTWLQQKGQDYLPAHRVHMQQLPAESGDGDAQGSPK